MDFPWFESRYEKDGSCCAFRSMAGLSAAMLQQRVGVDAIGGSRPDFAARYTELGEKETRFLRTS